MTEHEFRLLLEENDIDVTDPVWPEPGFVVAEGKTFCPTLAAGILLVDLVPVYSAAWL